MGNRSPHLFPWIMLYHFFLEKIYKTTYTAHKRIVLPTKTENKYRTTQACFGKIQL